MIHDTASGLAVEAAPGVAVAAVPAADAARVESLSTVLDAVATQTSVGSSALSARVHLLTCEGGVEGVLLHLSKLFTVFTHARCHASSI